MTKIFSKPLIIDVLTNPITADNNCDSSIMNRECLTHNIKYISNLTEKSETIPKLTQLTNKPSKKKAKIERQFIQKTTLFPSAKNEVVAFKYQLKKK